MISPSRDPNESLTRAEREELEKKSRNREENRHEVTDSGLSSLVEARLIKKAARDGWIQRFPTRESRGELAERIERQDGEVTAVDHAMVRTHELLGSADPRNVRAGVSAVVAMESANQRDEIVESRKEVTPEVTVNVVQQFNSRMEAAGGDDELVEHLYDKFAIGGDG